MLYRQGPGGPAGQDLARTGDWSISSSPVTAQPSVCWTVLCLQRYLSVTQKIWWKRAIHTASLWHCSDRVSGSARGSRKYSPKMVQVVLMGCNKLRGEMALVFMKLWGSSCSHIFSVLLNTWDRETLLCHYIERNLNEDQVILWSYARNLCLNWTCVLVAGLHPHPCLEFSQLCMSDQRCV